MCQHKPSVLLYSWILWARAQAEGVDSAPPGGPGSQREDWSDWDPTELSIRQRRWGLSLWPAAPSFPKEGACQESKHPREAGGGRRALSHPASEVTQQPFHRTLLVEGVTSKLSFKKRGHTACLSMAGVSTSVKPYLKTTTVYKTF